MDISTSLPYPSLSSRAVSSPSVESSPDNIAAISAVRAPKESVSGNRASENSIARPVDATDASARVERQQAREEAVMQAEIRSLAARDREVRAHEQAHAAVGGQYAGAPSYQFERGPDGVNYAVGGEVRIDVSKAASPQETILKMQIVRRAALAPAEPSAQDRRVAAEASAREAEARQALRTEQAERTEGDTLSESTEADDGDEAVKSAAPESTSEASNTLLPSSDQLQKRFASSQFISSRSGQRLDQLV